MKPIEPIYKMIGAKIEYVRRALGWRQEDLAKKTGLTRGSIANIEAGKQRLLLDDIETFSIAFNTTPKQLLKGIWF